MNGISRRNLLKQALLGVLIGSLPAPLRPDAMSEPYRLLASRLSACFANPDGARVIGRRYLALAPREADQTLLSARIAGSRQRYWRLAAADTSALRALLAEQQRRDFAAGRTVNVDGWILSRTEARLCALAALGPSPSG